MCLAVLIEDVNLRSFDVSSLKCHKGLKIILRNSKIK